QYLHFLFDLWIRRRQISTLFTYTTLFRSFRSEKNAIYSFLYGEFQPDSYNAKSLILVDRSNNDFFISKKENEQQLPASLAKLFRSEERRVGKESRLNIMKE